MTQMKVKSVRLEEELIAEVERALNSASDQGFRRPRFSDAIRYGLELFLAASGTRAHYANGRPISSIEHWRKISNIEEALKTLRSEDG